VYVTTSDKENVKRNQTVKARIKVCWAKCRRREAAWYACVRLSVFFFFLSFFLGLLLKEDVRVLVCGSE